MEVDIKPVKIKIAGEEYTVRGDTDDQTILQIADYVNRKIGEVAQKAPHQTTSRVTVLAALNMAEELFKERKNRQRELLEYETKANRLVEWLEHKLAEVSA